MGDSGVGRRWDVGSRRVDGGASREIVSVILMNASISMSVESTPGFVGLVGRGIPSCAGLSRQRAVVCAMSSFTPPRSPTDSHPHRVDLSPIARTRSLKSVSPRTSWRGCSRNEGLVRKNTRELYGIPEPQQGQRLTLDDIRETLIRQEETIIFAVIERAQFKKNAVIYEPNGLKVPNFDGCFSDFLLFELEKVYASVRRYTSPDETPFYPRDLLPEPVLVSLEYPRTLVENAININEKVRQVYLENILPQICEQGDDQNYGSSAVCDVACLQALSKRIHYGKFVAEAKFQQDPAGYSKLIAQGDKEAIWQKLTNVSVEEKLLKRVERKAAMIGQDIGDEAEANQVVSYKVEPSKVVKIYEEYIIPLTKEVQVLYLLQRI
ncbi:Chorismate mutase 3, chloroplastic [Porphyridium purpureum]|uniref:chorismate mutase n=1 Tax=Porphyridium purpureum TaxID=35688 RepID=A0A5J4YZN5_PORPP|nr:Chorismate mutase 3, chloroplastic [Porphyridium purpureum]|eukprot:POR2052..scf208_2